MTYTRTHTLQYPLLMYLKLTSACKKEHVVSDFASLGYLILNNFQIHLFSCLLHDFIFLYN